MEFSLDAKLHTDCIELGDMKLCKLLLMNDAQYPWFILVPRREGLREIYEMNRDDQISYMIESNLVAKMLVAVFQAEKLNIAALGNVVPQLHVHHIGRFKTDVSWPQPIWGQKPNVPYRIEEIEDLKKRVREQLGRNLTPPKPSN